jgi:hypothetical protein
MPAPLVTAKPSRLSTIAALAAAFRLDIVAGPLAQDVFGKEGQDPAQ